MIDKINHITVDGVEYPLVLNINVMESIQEKYGSFTEWGELIESQGREPNLKALKFSIAEMINEGIDIENDNLDVPRPPISLKKVGRIITSLGMDEMAKTVKNTIVDSTKVEDEIKNG